MTISVLTATLGKRPEMLAEAIDSVRAQTRPAAQHIVIDDGSGLVGPIEGVDVLPVSHRGLGRARNAGLEIATGEAIAILDDDDLWHPNHLATVWAAMQRTGADVVYTECVEDNRRDGYAITQRDFDAELLERENFICVCAALVRRAALQAVGGFGTGALEDWDTWKRMARAGATFVHVPEVTVTYRFHTDNITYGGVDPSLTRTDKDLRERFDAGELTWAEYEQRTTALWGDSR